MKKANKLSNKIIDKKKIKVKVDKFEYIITYINKRIKNMKLTVKVNNEIIVTGYNLKDEQIIGFVSKYGDWIAKSILKNNSRIDTINYKEYLDGNTMWLFGKEYNVLPVSHIINKDIIDNTIDTNINNIYNIIDNNIYISKQISKEELFNIVKKNNVNYLIERVNFYTNIFNKIPNLIIKDMKSKYGYNKYKDNIICLSSRLVHYPKEFIDYVIVHEFAHYYVHNHSKDFYNVVSTYMPNYKQILKRSKKFSLLIKY